MAKKFLDDAGLAYVASKVKSMISTAVAGKADSSHTHSAATTSAAGFMSTTDKSKLDGIATGANKYTHPTTSGNKHIPSGGSSGQILRWSSDGTAAWGADNNTTYSAATTSAAGLMSAADKTKLDGVATNATLSVPFATTAGTGAAFTATVTGITLTAGATIVIVPHTSSTTTSPTLNVNSLGAKTIKRRLSNLSSTTQAGYSNNWLYSGKPYLLVYDGSYWIVQGQDKPAAADLSGTVSVSLGGTGLDTLTAGSYLVGNGTSDVSLKTPAQVLSDIGAAASSHTQAASTITAGTFPGAVVAGASVQAVGTSLLRNSKIVSSATNPTNNGEIYWTYG